MPERPSRSDRPAKVFAAFIVGTIIWIVMLNLLFGPTAPAGFNTSTPFTNDER